MGTVSTFSIFNRLCRFIVCTIAKEINALQRGSFLFNNKAEESNKKSLRQRKVACTRDGYILFSE